MIPDPITGRGDVRGEEDQDLPDMPPRKVTLGQMLFVAREIKGMTVRDLEAKSGISNPLISQIETGKVSEPGFRTVVKLAKALGIPLDSLARVM